MTTSIRELSAIAYMAKELFEGIDLSDVSRQAAPRLRNVRLLGISLSNLDNVKELQPVQLSLFE
jgi:DNA polymerase-4